MCIRVLGGSMAHGSRAPARGRAIGGGRGIECADDVPIPLQSTLMIRSVGRRPTSHRTMLRLCWSNGSLHLSAPDAAIRSDYAV